MPFLIIAVQERRAAARLLDTPQKENLRKLQDPCFPASTWSLKLAEPAAERDVLCFGQFLTAKQQTLYGETHRESQQTVRH